MYCIILLHFGTWTFAVVIEAAMESSKQGYFAHRQATVCSDFFLLNKWKYLIVQYAI